MTAFPADESTCIFGAIEPGSGKVLLVVEVETMEEARVCIAAVAPMLGIEQVDELEVEILDELPGGVPTFLASFFRASIVAPSWDLQVQGTGTIH